MSIHSLSSTMVLVLVVVSLVALSAPTRGFEANKFKKCSDASFCRRQRTRPLHQGSHIFEAGSVSQPSKNQVQFRLSNSKNPNVGTLVVDLWATKDGDIRVLVNEHGDTIHPRYIVKDVLEPAQDTRLTPYASGDPTLDAGTHGSGYEEYVVTMPDGSKPSSVRIYTDPLRLDFHHKERVVVSLNARGLFNFEYYRFPADDQETDGGWDEDFQSHKDSKPRGPALVASDVSFIGAKHVYGIPEHATTLALKQTWGTGVSSEPYRLYNLDVFEYDLDLPFGLYGAVPFMMGHSQDVTSAILWLNAAETFVDVGADSSDAKLASDVWTHERVDTHWISESGVIDLTVFFGDAPADIFRKYARTTGKAQLPPLFSIGYHQCRWNYKDENDVQMVDNGFDEHDIPMDVLWLDIEHTNGKRYFTWDHTNFPTPVEMQKRLANKGRKMVTIIDPHIKRDDNYFLHKEAKEQGMYIKKADETTDYDGWCWPGSSSYLDFTNPAVRTFWANMFTPDKYSGSSNTLYTWNDMNEPSVFNGPEVTMHKDAIHHEGFEHRDVHNIYGMYVHQATYEGHDRMRSSNDRPFVLSRAFFAGTQRYGAIWTGDNAAKWTHLDAATPMLLSIGIAGIPFAGADVGGFFGNPSAELLVRWYQAGAFQPFFRGHAHLDTDRREPWIHGDPYTGDIRNAIVTRYAILPYLYTLFAQAHRDGMPVMRPLFVEFPEDGSLLTRDDSFMCGSAFLVKPVVNENQDNTAVYLPGSASTRWFDYDNYDEHSGGKEITVATPLRKIPVFVRGGSIITRRDRIRRAASLMIADPYTLFIALDANKSAQGELYVDDYKTRDHLRGVFRRTRYTFSNNVLEASDIEGNFQDDSKIERIVILGLGSAPSTVTGPDGSALGFTWTASSTMLTIKRPDVAASGSAWKVTLA